MIPGSRVSMFPAPAVAAAGLAQAWNSADFFNVTFSNSDRTITTVAFVQNGGSRATIGHSTGKWYAEVVVSFSNSLTVYIGLCNTAADLSAAPGGANNWMIRGDGRAFVNGAVGSLFAAMTSGDRVMIAYNTSTGKLWVGLNGTWMNSGNPAAGTGEVMTIPAGTMLHIAGRQAGSGSPISLSYTANFGHTAFTYSPPSGFSANG